MTRLAIPASADDRPARRHYAARCHAPGRRPTIFTGADARQAPCARHRRLAFRFHSGGSSERNTKFITIHAPTASITIAALAFRHLMQCGFLLRALLSFILEAAVARPTFQDRSSRYFARGQDAAITLDAHTAKMPPCFDAIPHYFSPRILSQPLDFHFRAQPAFERCQLARRRRAHSLYRNALVFS